MGSKTINTTDDVGSQIGGALALKWATATIGTDAITPSYSAVAVGSEAGATRDTLQVISATATAIYSGSLLLLKARNATEEIHVIHATSTRATATAPNIFLSGKTDFLVDDQFKSLTLQYDSQVATATGWYEISRGASDIALATEVVQQVIDADGAVAQGTTQIPVDGTTPNDSEGDEYMSVTIAPHKVGNILEFWSTAIASLNGIAYITLSLQSTQATVATGVMTAYQETTTVAKSYVLHMRKTATATSSQAFGLRMGPSAAATVTFNGTTATGLFGGVGASFLQVTEFDT